ncbi:MAG: hypothetical protein QXP01_02700, partial [Candidatus Hadarchaeum sp.]
EWCSALAAARLEMQNKQREQCDRARRVSVAPQDREDTFLDWVDSRQVALIDEEDPEIHASLRALTRDGEPPITVVACGTDQKGEPLAPDPKGEITSEQVVEMMRFSIPVALKHVYHVLKGATAESSPDNWRRNVHLKYARRVVFDYGMGYINGLRLILDEERGLEVEG